MDNVIVRDTT